MSQLESRFFQIYGLEHKSYEGLTSGDNWNGYECPWFSFEVATQLMHDLNESWKDSSTDESIVYDKEKDAFLYVHNMLEDNEIIKFSATKKNNKKVYGIGTYSWCWYKESDMEKEILDKKESYLQPIKVKNKEPHLKLVKM